MRLEKISNAWGKESRGLMASLSAEKVQFYPDEPILLRFQVKNVATQSQEVWHSGFWPNHQLLVKDATRANIPLTSLGQETRAVFGSDKSRRKNFPVTLAPGELDIPYGPYDLRDYFQIGKSVTLHVRCLYTHGSVEVFSNELILKIH